MIQLIEAPPRSGKSYFAVNYVMKFTKYDELYKEYVLDSNVLVISNIEGLKINHWVLSECLKERTIDEFFSIANFEKIMGKTGKNHVILLIDECHDLFPAGYKNDKIYSFFAFHGHIGLDIFLMTQGIESMSRMFNPLLEFIVKVTPRSKAILNQFTYGYYSKTGQFLYSKTLRKRQLVFGAYTSFRKDEQNKPKNALLHWAVITVLFLVVAGGLFKYTLWTVANKAKPKTAVVVKPPVVAPVSSPVTPVQHPSSSVRLAPVVAAVAPVMVAAALPVDLPRVIGLVGDADRKNSKYLLSTGQVVTCKRPLNIGDIYIR